jgi:NAD+ kinase
MTFGIIGNLEKERLTEVVSRLVRRLAEEQVSFVLHDALARKVGKGPLTKYVKMAHKASEQKLPSLCDMVIALGGDGTMLRTTRVVGSRRTPILGVNLGKLGFLAEVSIDELDSCISDILSGKFFLQERMLLEASARGLRSPFLALNDIVIDKAASSRVIDIATSVNGEFLATFTGDGIILSTPTGSTAYALSNGGPIVTPSNRTITISPICPHTLTVRPVIVPDQSVITLNIPKGTRKVHLTADGQLEKLLSPPLQVTVKRSSFTAQLVKRTNVTYYDLLRQKLQWGRDLRQGKPR